MPDNFAVVINETVTIWSAIKITLVVIAGLYLVVAATSWDKRAMSGLVLCLAMWLLTGCVLNEGSRPADAMIAQAQAQAAASAAISVDEYFTATKNRCVLAKYAATLPS